MAEYNINKFSYGSNTYKLEDDRMFIVTITYDDNTGNPSCDKTFNEIYAAYNEGKYIIGYAAVLHTYYYLKYIDGHGVYLEQLPSINDESHVIGNEGLFIDYNQVEMTGTQIAIPKPTTFRTATSGGNTWNVLKIDLGNGTAFCQCWSEGITLAASTYTAWGSYSADSSAQMFYHDYTSAAAFPVTFKNVPTCRVQSKDSQSMVWSFWSTTKTNIGTIRMIGQSTSSRSSTVMIHAAGLINV